MSAQRWPRSACIALGTRHVKACKRVETHACPWVRGMGRGCQKSRFHAAEPRQAHAPTPATAGHSISNATQTRSRSFSNHLTRFTTQAAHPTVPGAVRMTDRESRLRPTSVTNAPTGLDQTHWVAAAPFPPQEEWRARPLGCCQDRHRPHSLHALPAAAGPSRPAAAAMCYATPARAPPAAVAMSARRYRRCRRPEAGARHRRCCRRAVSWFWPRRRRTAPPADHRSLRWSGPWFRGAPPTRTQRWQLPSHQKAGKPASPQLQPGTGRRDLPRRR